MATEECCASTEISLLISILHSFRHIEPIPNNEILKAKLTIRRIDSDLLGVGLNQVILKLLGRKIARFNFQLKNRGSNPLVLSKAHIIIIIIMGKDENVKS